MTSALATNSAAAPPSKQTSVNLTTEMRYDVEHLSGTMYGKRGLSRWIEEALESFVEQPNFVSMVGAGEGKQTFPERKVIRLTVHAQDVLLDAVSSVRRIAPTLENVRAQILRAAFAHAIRDAQKPGSKFGARSRPAPAPIEIATKAPKLRKR